MELKSRYESALIQKNKATELSESGTMENLSDWLQLVSVADSELGTEAVNKKLKAFCDLNPTLNHWVDVDTANRRICAPLLVMVQFAGAAGDKKEKVRWMPMIVYKLGIEEDGKRLKKTPTKKDDHGPHFVYVAGVDFHGIGDVSNLSVWLKNTTSLSDLSNDPHIRKQRQQPKNWRLVNPQDGSTKPFFDVLGATPNTWLEKVVFLPSMERSGPAMLVPQLKTSTNKRKEKLTLLNIEWGDASSVQAPAPEPSPDRKRVSPDSSKKSPPKRQKAGEGATKKPGRPSKAEVLAAETLAQSFDCGSLNKLDLDLSQLDKLDLSNVDLDLNQAPPEFWNPTEPNLTPLELPLEFLK